MANFYNYGIDNASQLEPTSGFMEETECFNVTLLEAVPSSLGQWFLISLYTFTSCLALVGNLTVIVVETKGKESAHNIRKYLINLAVSDIILGVLCVPFTYTDFMLGQWIFPHWLCPTAQFVQLLSVFATSLTLTAIGVERYLATLHPFSSLHRWLESHTHIILGLTWVFGAVYAYVPITTTATRPFELNNITYYECTYDNNLSDSQKRIFMTSNLLLTFLLPLIVLILSYSAIMKKLISDQKKFQKTSFGESEMKLRVTKAPGESTTSCTCNASVVNWSSPNSNCTEGGQDDYRSTQVQSQSGSFRAAAALSTSSIDLRKSVQINHHSKTIKMMFMVILLFGICWMPIKVYQFCLDYHVFHYCTEQQLFFYVSLYFACHWMAMANSFVNPIVYSFMSKSFRNDFRKITHSFRRTFSNNIMQLSMKTTSTQV